VDFFFARVAFTLDFFAADATAATATAC